MAGRVSQVVVEAVIASTSSAVRVSQVAVEAVLAPDISTVPVRVSQIAVEAVLAPEPNLVVSVSGFEAARFGDPALVLSQSGVQVLRAPDPGEVDIDVSSAGIEVIRVPPPPNLDVAVAGFEVAYEVPKGTFTLDARLSPVPVTRIFGIRDSTYAYSGLPIVIKEGQRGPAVEFVIPGCDLSIEGDPITIRWDVWQSHFQWNQDKKEVAYLRRDGLTGLAMWYDDPQKDETDAGNAATGRQWHFYGTYQETRRSGRYVLTMKPAKGNATLYASEIYFRLETPGDGPGISLDAAIVVGRTGSFRVRAWKALAGSVEGASTVDAVIVRPDQLASFELGATLFVWGLGAFFTYATIATSPEASFTVAAQKVEEDGGVTTFGGDFPADALIGPHTGDFVLDAAIFGGRSTLFGLESFFAGWFALDAIVNPIGLCVWTIPGDMVEIGHSETLAFLMPLANGNMHFEIQLDQVATFDSPELRVIRSADQAGWEYWDGAWLPIPQAGVDPSFAGNEARYTIQDPLVGGVWFRRVRAGVI
jgi:hypothetical protein